MTTGGNPPGQYSSASHPGVVTEHHTEQHFEVGAVERLDLRLDRAAATGI